MVIGFFDAMSNHYIIKIHNNVPWDWQYDANVPHIQFECGNIPHNNVTSLIPLFVYVNLSIWVSLCYFL